MKGNQLILLIILVAIIGGVGSYLYFNRAHKQYLPAAMALPESSVAAWQGQKTQTLFTSFKQQEWYTFIRQNTSVQGFEKDYQYFDSIVNANSNFKTLLESGPLVVSLHVTAADNYQLLFLHQTDNVINTHDIEKLVKSKNEDARVIDHTFEDVKVFEIKNSQKELMFAYSFMDGVLAVSRNTELVEEAVHAFKENKSKSSGMVQKMVDGVAEDKMYINYTRLPDLINIYTSPEVHAAIKDIASLGEFGDYNLKAEKNEIRLTGALSTMDKKNYLWNALQDEKPKAVGLSKILPVGTGLFMSWCADSFNGYYAKYKAFLKATGKTEAWEKDKVETETTTGLNLERDITPLIGAEWGYALLEAGGENTSAEELLLLKPKDTTLAVSNLATLNKRVSASNLAGYSASNYRGFKINKIVTNNAFALLLGSMFRKVQSPYYTMVGDYIVFSQSNSALIKCIDAYLDKQTLSAATFYKDFSKSLVSESNFYLYISPSRAAAIGSDYIKESYKSRYQENFPTYKGFNCFGFQLASNGKDFFNQVTLTKASEKAGNSELAWSLALEADLQGSPHIVGNYETGRKEIMVQDKNNTLYLIGNSGNILWKRKLDEPVAGDIASMDLYKNERSEYLFATTNKLYLVDHTGADAGSYPLNLAEPTRKGLTLFDLDNDKEYTYLVNCERGRIYGYYGNGKPLPGWLPMNVDASLTAPVKTFMASGKNYFYGISAKGTVYLWNNKGTSVLKPVALKSGFKNPLIVSPENKVFAALDSTGTLYTVSFEGSVKKKAYSKFRNNPFLGFINKSEKGNAEYVLASDNMIAGYGSDSAEDWKLIASDKINIAPQILEFGDKKFIGYVSVASSKIYLFTPMGTPFAGFPRGGSTAFTTGDLLGNGDTDLIIGGPNKMLFHYRLSQ